MAYFIRVIKKSLDSNVILVLQCTICVFPSCIYMNNKVLNSSLRCWLVGCNIEIFPLFLHPEIEEENFDVKKEQTGRYFCLFHYNLSFEHTQCKKHRYVCRRNVICINVELNMLNKSLVMSSTYVFLFVYKDQQS